MYFEQVSGQSPGAPERNAGLRRVPIPPRGPSARTTCSTPRTPCGVCTAHFEGWTKSEQFRKAHAGAEQAALPRASRIRGLLGGRAGGEGRRHPSRSRRRSSGMSAEAVQEGLRLSLAARLALMGGGHRATARDYGGVSTLEVVRNLESTAPSSTASCSPRDAGRDRVGSSILFIVHTSDIVLECAGPLPPGTRRPWLLQATGTATAPIGRPHPPAHRTARPSPFCSAPVGMACPSRAIQFFNAAGEAMFKIFVRRDEVRVRIPAQIAKFDALRERCRGMARRPQLSDPLSQRSVVDAEPDLEPPAVLTPEILRVAVVGEGFSRRLLPPRSSSRASCTLRARRRCSAPAPRQPTTASSPSRLDAISVEMTASTILEVVDASRERCHGRRGTDGDAGWKSGAFECLGGPDHQRRGGGRKGARGRDAQASEVKPDAVAPVEDPLQVVRGTGEPSDEIGTRRPRSAPRRIRKRPRKRRKSRRKKPKSSNSSRRHRCRAARRPA